MELGTYYSKWLKRQNRPYRPVLYLSATGTDFAFPHRAPPKVFSGHGMTLQLEEVSWGECANFEISPRLVVSHVPHIPTGKIYVPEMRHEDARRGSGEGGMALKSRERVGDGKRRRETEGGKE